VASDPAETVGFHPDDVLPAVLPGVRGARLFPDRRRGRNGRRRPAPLPPARPSLKGMTRVRFSARLLVLLAIVAALPATAQESKSRAVRRTPTATPAMHHVGVLEAYVPPRPTPTIPSVVGRPLDRAADELRGHDFLPEVVGEAPSTEFAPGSVAQQDPPGNSPVPPGHRVVRLWLAVPPPPPVTVVQPAATETPTPAPPGGPDRRDRKLSPPYRPPPPPPPPPQAETRSPSDAISTSAVNSLFIALPSLAIRGSYRPRFGAVRHDATESRMRENRCLRCGKSIDSPRWVVSG